MVTPPPPPPPPPPAPPFEECAGESCVGHGEVMSELKNMPLLTMPWANSGWWPLRVVIGGPTMRGSDGLSSTTCRVLEAVARAGGHQGRRAFGAWTEMTQQGVWPLVCEVAGSAPGCVDAKTGKRKTIQR